MKAAVMVPINSNGVIMVHKTCIENYPWGCDTAFPGGRIKESETIIEAALREAREEICLDPQYVRPLSILPPETPRNMPEIKVYPVVFQVNDNINVKVCSYEIDKVFIVPWEKICNPVMDHWIHPIRHIKVKGLKIEENLFVWGMTLRILEKIRKNYC